MVLPRWPLCICFGRLVGFKSLVALFAVNALAERSVFWFVDGGLRHTMMNTRLSRSILIAVLSVVALIVPLSSAAGQQASYNLPSADPSEVGLSKERLERLDGMLQAMVDSGELAGVVTMLARHGKIAFVDVAGVRDIESKQPMTRDSIFRIQSMTKPITGVAMMMLFEEGKWRLNDPVSRYIPEFDQLTVYDGENSDGSIREEELERPITMRDLMIHTAGLPYTLDMSHPVNRMFRDQRVINVQEPLQAMIDKMAMLPLLAQPGTRWIYSSSVDVQSHLVEKLSGQAFADFLDERIFGPLQMVDTAFYVPVAEVGRVATRHRLNAQGVLQRLSGRPPLTAMPQGPTGGAGLYSTADDYLRFTQMLLNGGELNGVRLLSPRTVEMMRTNHLSKEATRNIRPGMGFGMDFMVYMDPAAAGEPHSPGSYYWLGIDGTWFWIDPELDFTFVGMMQHTPYGRLHGLSRNLVYQSIVN
jgi:CubicO group peptidase (beta-lactamase class C family)